MSEVDQSTDRSFVVDRIGAVPGTTPVSVVAHNGNAFLLVYDDAFFSPKGIIYRLNNLREPYRILKGTVLSFEGRMTGSDHVCFGHSGKILAGANYFTHFRFSGFVYDIDNDQFTRVSMERYYGKVSVGGGSQMFALDNHETLMVIASSLSNNSQLRIFDISNPEQPENLFIMHPPGKLFDTKSLGWSPDSTIVAHHGHYINDKLPPQKMRGIFLWKIDRNTTPKTLEHIGTLTYASHNHDDVMVDLAFSPDGQMLVLGADRKSSDRIKLFDLHSQQLVLESDPLDATTVSLFFSPNGKYLISGEKDGHVRIWTVSPTSLSLYKTIATPGEIFQICLSIEDKQVYVAHQDTKKTVAVSRISIPTEILN